MAFSAPSGIVAEEAEAPPEVSAVMPRRALDVKGRNSREAKVGMVKAIVTAIAIAMAAATVDWTVRKDLVVGSVGDVVMNRSFGRSYS